MKLRSLLTVAALATSLGASAQNWVNDTVTVGATYNQDVWYSMANGAVKSDSNAKWDLAFSAIPSTYARSNPHYGVGAWINSAVSSSGVTTRLYSLHRKASTDFASITGADTVGKLTARLNNTDTSYGYGAFNMNGTASGFNYGWGSYDQTTHNITGDSVYIAIRGTAAYKIWIEEYVSLPPTTWKFHVQKLDTTGNPAQTVNLNITANYDKRLFAYYSFANGPLDREPASNTWDLNFTRYTTNVDLGGGVAPNPIAGVLSNPYIKVAKVNNTPANTGLYQNYTFSQKLNTIGWTYRTGAMAGSNFVLDTVNYFVLANDAKYYQLEFTTATTSTTGRVGFRKRLIATTAIHNVNNSISNYYAAPNPANNSVNLMIDAKESTTGATLAMVDMSGRMVSSQTINTVQGINAFTINTANVPAGIYFLSVTGNNIKLNQKLTVAH